MQNAFKSLWPARRRGAIAVLAAFFLIVAFGFAAFSIDVGYLVIVDQELQSAVDSATLAAAQELMLVDNNDYSKIRSAAVELAGLNEVNGNTLKLDIDRDVEMGRWDPNTRIFTAVPQNAWATANAIQVTGRLGHSGNGSVNLFFAPVIGHRTVNSESTAIAVIAETKPRDVMLVIDRSGSMNAHRRMEYTKSAANVLLDQLGEDDKVGISSYSWNVTEEIQVITKKKGKKKTTTQTITRLSGRLDQGLDLDTELTRSKVAQLNASDRTNIGGGMRIAIEEFLANPRVDELGKPVQQVMVLMTDGMANETEPPAVDPVDSIYYYAYLAQANKITIHGITLGREADEVNIQEAARITGGKYYHVEDNDFEGLFEIYRGIGRGTDQPRLVR